MLRSEGTRLLAPNIEVMQRQHLKLIATGGIAQLITPKLHWPGGRRS
jgi:hypothetical protein